MNTATTTISLNPGYFSARNWFDWLFAAVVIAGGAYAFASYAPYMDVYEKGILVAAVPAAIWVGWMWRPLRVLMLVVAAVSLLAIGSYQGTLANAETKSIARSVVIAIWPGRSRRHTSGRRATMRAAR